VTQADGKSYPPIIPDPVCDPITGTSAGGVKLEDVPEPELTPLQRLLRDSKNIPLTFGSLTKRRGFVIEPKPFFRGNARNLDTVIKFTPGVMVADSIPGRSDFKIIARRTTGFTATDKFSAQVNRELDIVVAARKEGKSAGFPFGGGEIRRLFIESIALKKIIDDGERQEIKDSTNTAEELQLFRVIAPAASILFALKNEGAG
jgi:hypothetical protein